MNTTDIDIHHNKRMVGQEYDFLLRKKDNFKGKN